MNMRAVDQVDMQNSFSGCLRKTIKWYKKLFFRLFDIAVQNSYSMYNVRNGKTHELSEFRQGHARELFEEYGSTRSQMKGKPSTDSPPRLTACHFIAFVHKDNVKKRCFVCNHTVKWDNKRCDTRFHCPDCDVPLCNPDCFTEYYSLTTF